MHRVDPATLAAAAAAAAPAAAMSGAGRLDATGAAGGAPTRTIATPAVETGDRTGRPGPPEGSPTPAQTPDRSRRPGAGGLAAVGLLVALAVAAGLLVGGSGSSGGSGNATFTNSASVGPLELGFPAAWQRTPEAPQVPGLGLRNPLVLASPPPGTGRLEAGTVAATGPTLLPPALLALLAARPAGEPVRIGALQALRYDGLAPRGLPGGVTLYVVATSQGVLTLACRPGSAPGATFGADCARVAATARLVGARAYPLGPSPVLARQLEAAFTRLSGARRAGEAHLRVAASAAAQAAADRELADAYARAGREVAAAAGNPLAAGVGAQISAALAAVARAYRGAGSAAAARSTAAYAAAGRALAAAGADLRRATAGLAELGYRVSRP
ncbi:MAG: hypothetical protein LC720_02540 [Actinobacteria bacterium]|nr:hypothetical protein [Actinomycetota bacterium]